MGSRDFLLKLILKTDKQSFDSGARSVDSVSNNISRMIGVARNAAAALGVLAAVSSAGEAKELKLANALGVSSKRLDEFKVAAKIAGTNADGLVQSMASLDQAMTDYAFGKNNPGLEKALGILSTRSGMSMNIENLRSMDAADRVEYVLKAAQMLANKKEAASLVNDILGGAGKDFYWALDAGGKSIESALANARSVLFTDESSKQKAFGFTTELNETLQIMKQIGLLAGSEVGGFLTPFLSEINEFLKDDRLKDKIKQFAEAFAKIGDAIRPFAEGTLKTAITGLYDLVNAVSAFLSGDVDTAYDNGVKFFKGLGKALKDGLLGEGEDDAVFLEGSAKSLRKLSNKGVASNIIFGNMATAAEIIVAGEKAVKDLTGPDKKAETSAKNIIKAGAGGVAPTVSNNYLEQHGLGIQDGIMRPDGTITRVAPDDWVFAARNIGDLARMFMPQSLQPAYAGGGSVVINQTLTLNGAADFPQSARRAAYDGTMEALRKMDATRERRYLMPGTR